MSKVDMISYTCPKCGWTIKTPFGAEDAAEHTKLHTDKHHSDKTAKARITKSELIKLQRK